MHTIRIIKCPIKWDALDIEWTIFTFWKDVGIVKDDYIKTSLNLAKALLDVGYIVRVRKDVYKESKNGENTIKSIGIEIDFDWEKEKPEIPKEYRKKVLHAKK